MIDLSLHITWTVTAVFVMWVSSNAELILISRREGDKGQSYKQETCINNQKPGKTVDPNALMRFLDSSAPCVWLQAMLEGGGAAQRQDKQKPYLELS